MTASEGIIRVASSERPVTSSSQENATVAHLCFVLCLLLASLPVLVVETPPLFDYANHLARVHVIGNYESSSVFPAHFEVTSFLIPNVLADVVLLLMMPVMGILAAGKALLLLTFALTLGGAYALNRVLTGHYSIWPLFAATLLYHEMFFWGFLNYDLGLALLLCGLAAWFHLENQSRGLQLAVGTLLALLIFLAHLVSFGLYGFAIAAIELHRVGRSLRRDGVNRQTLSRGALRLALSAAQFLPALVIFFALSPSSGLDPVPRFDFSLFGKAMPFTRVLSSGNPPLDFLTLGLVGGFILLALVSRRVSCHGILLTIAGIYFLLVMSLPYTLLGSFFLDSRIVIAVALILVASLRPADPEKHNPPLNAKGLGRVAAILLVGIVGIRSVGLISDWREQERHYDLVLTALNKVPPGSVIITAVGHPFELGDWFATRYIKPAHEHTTLYATIHRNALVPNIFARRGQNPLVFSSSLKEFNQVSFNPVPRIYTPQDARWLVNQARPVAEKRDTITPPIPGVFIIGYHIPCDRWPQDQPLREVHCHQTFSLIELEYDQAPTTQSLSRQSPEMQP
ncbi:hypothetical protein [Telmatospirillum sp. J64-1]|uniref:hypothetical protein n=1 Tax=Telmatospirillum sp. J64-1 TaxID=2502183 RepID=UPI00115DB1CA|nr:hypothetical protein [Telmatospirillum sp. J64-1]